VLSDSQPWPAASDDCLRSGIQRIYRKGRKAFARADADGDEEALHESRKQTKYLGAALQVLAAARGGSTAKRVKQAEAIADELGDDHDLAVVRGKLTGQRRSGSSRRALLAQIDGRRQKLQRKAARHSRRLYRRKPKAFVAALDFPAA
jgi:CHAD domain-containing protein